MPNFFRLSFIFLASLFFIPLVQAQEKADPRIVLSKLKFDNQENLEESQRILQSALAFDPGNPDYHFELSRVYGALYDESAAASKKNIDPNWLNLSQNELEQVLMIRPQDIPAHYNLGVIYKRRGKMERARDEFHRVLKLTSAEKSTSPTAISAWLQIGATYEEQGFLEDAEDAYMKARQLGGSQPEVQEALESLQMRQRHERENPRMPGQVDSWTRQYVSGAEYAQFGSQAIRAQSQSAGMGALLPAMGQMLFQQFMSRRAARATQNDAGDLSPAGN